MTFLGAFMLVDLEDENEVLYKEELVSDQVVHVSGLVSRYRARFERLWEQAL